MRLRRVAFASFLMLLSSAVWAQSDPSVSWLADDLFLPLRDGTAIDFAFPYDVHLVGGADPEGDATLSLTLCQNRRCTEQSLAVI